MSKATTERRKRVRLDGRIAAVVKLTTPDDPPRTLAAEPIDNSEYGLGVRVAEHLTAGSLVTVSSNSSPQETRARVAWCHQRPDGRYYAGLSFSDLGCRNPLADPPEAATNGNFVDYYEVLQLSPNADPDTIHRVFRMLAQRHHPDNPETGNENNFKLLMRAYKVLSDPEQRAAYDSEHTLARRLRWKVFDQPASASGVESERSKRFGILSLLYTKRMNQPEHPTVSLHEIEDLLGVPREHLEFTLWFLKEQIWVTRTDNGRYSITARGVDHAEQNAAVPAERKMLPEASLA